MNKQEILTQLEEEFPGKTTLCLPEDDPKEIICETDPATDHPEYSEAVAFIDRSEPHHHEKSVETYVVERGRLSLFVDGEEHVLEEGDTYVVHPPMVHHAEGKATRVIVRSEPGWTFEDHILEG